MKTLIPITVWMLFFVLCAGEAMAQERNLAYYNDHAESLLPDAKKAFSNGNYERTLELCEWYYIIKGDSLAESLKEKAAQCADLSRQMKAFAEAGDYASSQKTAKAILAINPNDKEAKRLQSYDPLKGSIGGHEWVDLGLSVKWATCNVGANSPSDYGSYFAWGETSPKDVYLWSNLQYCSDKTGDSLTKYNTDLQKGAIDLKEQLDLTDDAANVNWGGSWRMPTEAEMRELIVHCKWQWTKLGGKNGYKVTSLTNGNSIFLPAAGFRRSGKLNDAGSLGYYWSSSLDWYKPNCAWYMYFGSSEVGTLNDFRCYGPTIRPVTE